MHHCKCVLAGKKIVWPHYILNTLTSFSAAVFSTNLEPWPGLPGQRTVIPAGQTTCLLTNTHTHTHTHTHIGFYGLRGLSIGVMVFILYKLYVLLPYTYPTPKLSPHRRRCISIFPQKNSLCIIYKRFKLWGHWKCPHKSPSPCITYVIPMSLYKFVSS